MELLYVQHLFLISLLSFNQKVELKIKKEIWKYEISIKQIESCVLTCLKSISYFRNCLFEVEGYIEWKNGWESFEEFFRNEII